MSLIKKDNRKSSQKLYELVKSTLRRVSREEVVSLLGAGASSSYRDIRFHGKTALHFAAKNDHIEAVKVMLNKHNAQQLIEMTDNYGWSLLHFAAINMNDNTKMIDTLFENPQIKWDINRKTKRDQDAMEIAAENRNWKICRYLKNLMHPKYEFQSDIIQNEHYQPIVAGNDQMYENEIFENEMFENKMFENKMFENDMVVIDNNRDMEQSNIIQFNEVQLNGIQLNDDNEEFVFKHVIDPKCWKQKDENDELLNNKQLNLSISSDENNDNDDDEKKSTETMIYETPYNNNNDIDQHSIDTIDIVNVENNEKKEKKAYGIIDCQTHWKKANIIKAIRIKEYEFMNWYQMNLRDLTEYCDLFDKNDLNDIQLIAEIDDFVLSHIGIQKRAHRQYILQAISKSINNEVIHNAEPYRD